MKLQAVESLYNQQSQQTQRLRSGVCDQLSIERSYGHTFVAASIEPAIETIVRLELRLSGHARARRARQARR